MMHGANMKVEKRRVHVILTRHISHLYLNYNVRELGSSFFTDTAVFPRSRPEWRSLRTDLVREIMSRLNVIYQEILDDLPLLLITIFPNCFTPHLCRFEDVPL